MFEIANRSRGYYTTGKTVFSCQYLVIWCTKYRRKVLDNTIQARLVALIHKKEDDSGYQVTSDGDRLFRYDRVSGFPYDRGKRKAV